MMTNLIEKMNAMATGGTFKELSTSSFKTLQIPLPPLAIQEEIVAEIEGYQREIENYKSKINALEFATKDRIAKVWGTSDSFSTGTSAGAPAAGTPAAEVPTVELTEKALPMAAEGTIQYGIFE